MKKLIFIAGFSVILSLYVTNTLGQTNFFPGNVGIGESNPTKTLEIKTEYDLDPPVVRLNYLDGSTPNNWDIENYFDLKFKFGTTAFTSAKVIFKSNGDVGIGTLGGVTYSKLTIASNQPSTSNFNWLTFDNQASGYGDWSFTKTASNDLSLSYGTSAGQSYTNAITFKYGGNMVTPGTINNKGINLFNNGEMNDWNNGIKLDGFDYSDWYIKNNPTNDNLFICPNQDISNGMIISPRSFSLGNSITIGKTSLNFSISNTTNGYSIIQSTKYYSSDKSGVLVINPLGGNVGIGTNDPLTKLHVNGDLRVDGAIYHRGILKSQEIKVEMPNEGWQDRVFDKNYKLRTLAEVEEFIKANGHLPEIPSNADVVRDGVNLGDMQAKLLMKVEELMLYVIELEKKDLEKSKRIEELEKVINEKLK